jgi:hypothetical protein
VIQDFTVYIVLLGTPTTDSIQPINILKNETKITNGLLRNLPTALPKIKPQARLHILPSAEQIAACDPLRLRALATFHLRHLSGD